MIRLIVYSRDRAAQLSLFLRSIELYAPNTFNISIIWNYSSDFFQKGYEKLIQSTDNITWCYQKEKSEFKKFTLYCVEEFEHICFSTDDEVVFQTINRQKLFDNLPKFDNHIFSLRLGFNTLVQDCHKENNFQPPLNIYVEKDGVLTWPINFYHPHHNYGYFGSLDMTIYRRSLLQKILPKINFKNTNELEGGLTQFRDECNYISSFNKSVAVNLPVNNMSGYTTINDKYSYSNEELNQKYLDGYEIDLESISQTRIIGSHQQIKLEFIKKS